MIESTCCAVMRKMGGKKCPICLKPIRLAKVLRLLRFDARQWWYHQALRTQGRTDEAIKLERASIRNDVKFIRANVGRRIETYRTDVILFPDRPVSRPFDLKPMSDYQGYTTGVSGCHPGAFAAFIHCYAHRIGHKMTAKEYDLV